MHATEHIHNARCRISRKQHSVAFLPARLSRHDVNNNWVERDWGEGVDAKLNGVERSTVPERNERKEKSQQVYVGRNGK